MRSRAKCATGIEPLPENNDDGTENLNLRVSVQYEVLKVINRRRGRACNTQRETAAAVRGEFTVSPGGHIDLSDTTAHREVTQCRPVDGLAGRCDLDCGVSIGCDRREDNRKSQGSSASHNVPQFCTTIERHLIIAGAGWAGSI